MSCPSATSNSRFTWNCYPMLTGIGYIASKTRAKMRTLQAAAPIPAFMAGSMLWLRRRNGSVVILAFEGTWLRLLA
jgi:hypothetical protein